jgi:beta-glucosidase
VKELKGFKKIELEPGESKEVSFVLKSQDLAFYGFDGKWAAEPGEFKIFVGPNSRDLKEASFVLK